MTAAASLDLRLRTAFVETHPYDAARSLESLSDSDLDSALEAHALDVIVAPTASPAWKIDWICGDNRKGGASAPAAVAGYPHVTVPMGRVAHLPVGLSLFAGGSADAAVIAAARAFEALTDAECAPAAHGMTV